MTAETKTVLLTLGRLPVALDIARSFASHGWRVLVAEPYSMHLARMSRSVDTCFRIREPARDADGYLEDLASIVSDHNVDLVIPVSEETMHVAALETPADVFCMPQPESIALHDKFRFIDIARSLDLPVPATRLADDPARADVTRRPFVVKPRFSCSGRGVSYHDANADTGHGDDALIQERLDGEHVSVFCIARDGATLAQTAYRGSVMDGSVAVAFEGVNCEPARGWANTFVEKTSHTGFIAFDFILGDDGIARAIECNPRVTSGIHFVETSAVASAILGQNSALDETAAVSNRVESYSCFTKLLGNLFRPAEFRRVLRELRRSRDVTWSRNDPWPFLLMMINTWRILWLSMTRRETFAAAAMLDIEWRPPGPRRDD